jgi:hypothetical protein
MARTRGASWGYCSLCIPVHRHRDDLAQAFINYERTLRPIVVELQKISLKFIRLLLLETQWESPLSTLS